jgi:hypothetical protein
VWFVTASKRQRQWRVAKASTLYFASHLGLVARAAVAVLHDLSARYRRNHVSRRTRTVFEKHIVGESYNSRLVDAKAK